jgi:hypothetical protein
MTFKILYCKNNNEIITLEWVAPSDWSTAAVRECFERRYAQTEVISVCAVS